MKSLSILLITFALASHAGAVAVDRIAPPLFTPSPTPGDIIPIAAFAGAASDRLSIAEMQASIMPGVSMFQDNVEVLEDAQYIADTMLAGPSADPYDNVFFILEYSWEECELTAGFDPDAAFRALEWESMIRLLQSFPHTSVIGY